MKYKRQSEILKIIKEKKIRKHEQLLHELTEAGFDVTQATVSRDIKDLGLVKIQDGRDGAYYAPSVQIGENINHKVDMFSNSVRSIECAYHTVVIRTYRGMASAVATSIDSMPFKDILGTVAGDDAIIIVCTDNASALETTEHLKKMFRETLI